MATQLVRRALSRVPSLSPVATATLLWSHASEAQAQRKEPAGKSASNSKTIQIYPALNPGNDIPHSKENRKKLDGIYFDPTTLPHANRSTIQSMTVLKRYVLRLFISLKYITANVVDRNNGRIIATASTIEHSLKNTLECGRSCNAKAATVVGEVLAMRLRVEGLEHGQGRGIHIAVKKEIEKKGFKSSTKIWAVVNALKNNGVKVILEDDNVDTSTPGYGYYAENEFMDGRSGGMNGFLWLRGMCYDKCFHPLSVGWETLITIKFCTVF